MPLTVILIEDSITIRESLIAALADLADAQVIAVADTPDAGIAALHEHKENWQLAIVDMFLKNGSGMQVLRAWRVRPSHQRLIVLTNYPTPEIRKRCLALGADAVFDKSTELDEFFEQCRAASDGQV